MIGRRNLDAMAEATRIARNTGFAEQHKLIMSQLADDRSQPLAKPLPGVTLRPAPPKRLRFG